MDHHFCRRFRRLETHFRSQEEVRQQIQSLWPWKDHRPQKRALAVVKVECVDDRPDCMSVRECVRVFVHSHRDKADNTCGKADACAFQVQQLCLYPQFYQSLRPKGRRKLPWMERRERSASRLLEGCCKADLLWNFLPRFEESVKGHHTDALMQRLRGCNKHDYCSYIHTKTWILRHLPPFR